MNCRPFVLVVLALAGVSPFAPSAVSAQRTDTLRLSLREALTLALREGDDARIARAQAEVAEAQVVTALAGGLPQVRVNGGYTRVLESARGQAVGSFFNQPNTYSSSITVSQTLFQGGRVVSGVHAAKELREAARFAEAEVRQQASLEVERAYLQTLFAAQLVEIHEANYALASARLTQSERFQQAGRSSRYDVLRARVERANLEPQLIQARTDRDVGELDLKRLLHLPADQPVRLTTTIGADDARLLLTSARADSGGTLPRAAVRAAEKTAAARHEAVDIARADYLPTISTFAQFGYRAFPRSGVPTGAGRLSFAACPTGSAAQRACQNGGWFSDQLWGVTLSWTLFDGLRTRSAVDVARAQARAADAEASRARENAAIEIARARAALARSRSLYAARSQTAGEAREAFRLASLRLARGLSTQLDVSDAQIALLAAQTNEARATFDVYLAAAGLAIARGQPVLLPWDPSAVAPPRNAAGSPGEY